MVITNKGIKSKSENIGIITNSITEQLFSRDYKLIKIPYDNFEVFLKTIQVDLVILDNHIYEIDHPWFEKDYKDLMCILQHKEILIVKNDSYPLSKLFMKYNILNFELNTTEIVRKDNITITPLLVNEMLFNPAYTIKKNDIVFLNRFNKPHNANILDLISRKNLNITDSNIDCFTSQTFIELNIVIRKSRFIYIYNSVDIDPYLLKFIEIISYLQNTIVIYEESQNNIEQIKYIEFLYSNPLYLERETIKYSRNTFINNSLIMNKSINEIFKETLVEPEIKVSVITSTIRSEYIEYYIKQLNKQNGVTLEVILLTHKFEFNDIEKEKLQKCANFKLIIIKGEESDSLGKCLNKCLNYASYEYVAKIDDDDYYTSNYLMDSYLALKYSNASIVGKGAHFVYLQSENMYIHRFYNNNNKFVNRVIGGSIFSKTSLLTNYLFDDVSLGEDSRLFKKLIRDGHLIYANHPYETCLFRSSNKFSHTWQVEEDYIISGSKVISLGDPVSFINII